MGDFSYSKRSKLKSKNTIDAIFESGEVVKAYPIRIHFLILKKEQDSSSVQAGFSVSKRYFKRAVDRNRIKRLMREAYRHHKLENDNILQEQQSQLAMMVIWSNREMPDRNQVTRCLKKGLKKIEERLSRQ